MTKILSKHFLLILLLAWWAGVKISNISPYIFPSPDAVIKALYDNYYLVLKNAVPTFCETFIAIIISLLVGFVFAQLLDKYLFLQKTLQPLFVVLQTIPSFILMPLLTVWFGFGLCAKMVAVCLSAFFPITLCFFEGLQRVDKNLLDLAKIMHAVPYKTQISIKLPAALPSLFAGIRLACICAPITVLACEWNGGGLGLGYLVIVCQSRLQIDLMFACIFLVIIMTISLNKIVKIIQQRLIFWP